MKRLVQENKEWIRALVDNAMDAIVGVDDNHEIVIFNKAAERVFGVSAEEAIGGTVDRFIPERFRQSHHGHLDGYRNSGESPRSGFSMVTAMRANGEEFPIEASISRSVISDRVLMTAVIRDVSQARRDEERLRAFLVSSSYVVYQMSADWTEMRRLDGRGFIEDTENASRDWMDRYIHPDDQEMVRQKIKEAIHEKKMFSLEHRVKRTDGTLGWTMSRAVPIIDSEGRITEWVGTAADVTERKYIERQVSHLQKMEALGRLAGGIAHDFNNMLQIIRGNIELALAGNLGGRMRHNLEDALEGVNRGSELVKQLMVFSRQRPPQEPTPIDLNSVLGEIEKMVPRLIGEQIRLEIHRAKGLPQVVGDGHQVFQAIVNVIINSKDAMPNGGVIVVKSEAVFLDEHYARQHLDVKVGKHVLVSITDNGHGMPPHVKERMFDPFFTTKPEGSGTGLGLSLVVGAMRTSGGHATAYSEEGKGTTINLFFPVRGEAAVVPSVASIARLDGAILIVEDELALREIMCEVLTANGYAVFEATNGVEALDVAQRHKDRIKLVISDVVMPSMGGVEMTRRLRKIVPDFGLILMSGYNGIEVKEASGSFRSLRKPFAMNELLATIRDITEKEQ